MPAADFAAAQARLAARRQARQQQHSTSLSDSQSRLPFPLTSLSPSARLAWSNAWQTIASKEGSRPAFRVGQVDAELLDEELLDLLKGQVGDAVKYFGSHLQTDWAPEILLALRALLFKLSIWDHDASYGASLQGLRYTDARHKDLSRPRPTKWQKTVYGLVTVLGRYGWTKWEDYLLQHQADYPSAPRAVTSLSSLTSSLSTLHNATALVSFLTFLYNGRYRTILDRILSLRLVPASSQTSHQVSFEYLNRQLVWHAFTEFLLFILPLVGVARWRRIISRTWTGLIAKIRAFFGQKTADSSSGAKQAGQLAFLPEATCAICYFEQSPVVGAGADAESPAVAEGQAGGVVGSAATDITNPYEAIPCGCVYCFVCLAQRIAAEEGDGWTCLRCGMTVRECKPWHGDIVQEVPRPGSGNSKSVGFAGHEPYVPLTPGASDVTIKELEPIPTEDELETVDEELADAADGGADEVVHAHINESAEWARASELLDEQESANESEESSDDDSAYNERYFRSRQ